MKSTENPTYTGLNHKGNLSFYLKIQGLFDYIRLDDVKFSFLFLSLFWLPLCELHPREDFHPGSEMGVSSPGVIGFQYFTIKTESNMRPW